MNHPYAVLAAWLLTVPVSAAAETDFLDHPTVPPARAAAGTHRFELQPPKLLKNLMRNDASP